jgi:hypothetical protein
MMLPIWIVWVLMILGAACLVPVAFFLLFLFWGEYSDFRERRRESFYEKLPPRDP